MNSIDKEKRMLAEWAVNESNESRMHRVNYDVESYYEKVSLSSDYIMTYSMDSLEEMTEMMDRVLDASVSDKVKRICMASALKSWEITKERSENLDEKEVLPDFIYAF